jgi:hypothetical protein
MGVQHLANTTGLRIHVSHFPPGTSKWNKIEHRMFAFITQNWRGRPLVSYETIINLVGSTTTTSGLRIKAKLNRKKHEIGLKDPNADLAKVNLKPVKFHGDWNCAILSNLAQIVQVIYAQCLSDPDQMYFQVVDAMRRLAVVFHAESLLKFSPEGEGFSPIPRGGTLSEQYCR